MGLLLAFLMMRRILAWFGTIAQGLAGRFV
jgi:hypothetical protein